MISIRDAREPDEPQSRQDENLRSKQRRTLFRVLATNIVRELRDGGYHGHELIGFASEVMSAITENGWTHREDDAEACGNGRCGAGSDSEPAGSRDHDAVIENEHLILRPPMLEDKAVLETWNRDPEVCASLIPKVITYVSQNLAHLHRISDRTDRIVCDRATRAAIGMVSLHHIDSTVGQAELGKVIGEPAYRGRGFAVQATRLIVAYGFNTLGLNRIYLRTLGANVKNVRLNQRMGFRFEGVLRQAAFSNGQPTDVLLMAMLRNEFVNA